MYELVILAEAKAELRHEANYSKTKWGKTHGKKYIDELQTKIGSLKKNPHLYPKRDDILTDIHILNYKGNRIIYTIREEKKQVIILAILSVYQHMENLELSMRYGKVKLD
ncbi:hypothetical protein GF373_01295 [bacterium]|nr:hypothetical protein [bacterium]